MIENSEEKNNIETSRWVITLVLTQLVVIVFRSDGLERFPQDMTVLNNEFQTILFQYHLKHSIHLTNFIQISLIS